MLLCHQHFLVLTEHKPEGRRWVTKEQYLRYFLLCGELLNPAQARPADQATQRRALSQEWEKDRCGMPALTSPLFYKAVFELIGVCAH
jgi:hypothetical protein